MRLWQTVKGSQIFCARLNSAFRIKLLNVYAPPLNTTVTKDPSSQLMLCISASCRCSIIEEFPQFSYAFANECMIVITLNWSSVLCIFHSDVLLIITLGMLSDVHSSEFDQDICVSMKFAIQKTECLLNLADATRHSIINSSHNPDLGDQHWELVFLAVLLNSAATFGPMPRVISPQRGLRPPLHVLSFRGAVPGTAWRSFLVHSNAFPWSVLEREQTYAPVNLSSPSYEVTLLWKNVCGNPRVKAKNLGNLPSCLYEWAVSLGPSPLANVIGCIFSAFV